MKCPKCGKEMTQREMNGIMYHVCEDCRVKRQVKPTETHNESITSISSNEKKLNVPILVSLILGGFYLILCSAFFNNSLKSSSSASDLIDIGNSMIIMAPQLISVFLAVLFNILTLILKNKILAIVGFICYSISLVFSFLIWPLYTVFVIPELILSLIGWIMMKKH